MLWTLSVIASTFWPALSRLKLAVKPPLSFRLAVDIILIIFFHSRHFSIPYYIIFITFDLLSVSGTPMLSVLLSSCHCSAVSAWRLCCISIITITIHTHRISSQPVAQSGPVNWMLTCLAVSVWHVTVAMGNQSLSANHGWLMGLTSDRKKKSNQPRLRYLYFNAQGQNPSCILHFPQCNLIEW